VVPGIMVLKIMFGDNIVDDAENGKY